MTRLLNVSSDVDDVTVAGKLFHTRAAATGKAQSPTVDKCVEGTLSASVNDERRRRRSSRSVELGLVSQQMGWVGSGHTKWTQGQLWSDIQTRLSQFVPLTVIFIIISFPSPTHSFIPGLKHSFSANPSHCSLSFSSSGLTT